MTACVEHNGDVVSAHETDQEAHDAAASLWRQLRADHKLSESVSAWRREGPVPHVLFMNGRSTWRGLGQDRYGFID